jgi:hypothetical protein
MSVPVRLLDVQNFSAKRRVGPQRLVALSLHDGCLPRGGRRSGVLPQWVFLLRAGSRLDDRVPPCARFLSDAPHRDDPLLVGPIRSSFHLRIPWLVALAPERGGHGYTHLSVSLCFVTDPKCKQVGEYASQTIVGNLPTWNRVRTVVFRLPAGRPLLQALPGFQGTCPESGPGRTFSIRRVHRG